MGDTSFIALGVFGFIGLAVGYFCGRWPYDAAMQRGQDTLGLVALITCTACGLFGCFLALPVAFVFRLVIVGTGNAPERDRRGYTGLAEEDYNRMVRNGPREKRTTAPYTLIGPLVVCNECQHGSSKTDGEVPPECPKCGEPFRNDPKPRKANRVAEAVEVVELTAVVRPPRS